MGEPVVIREWQIWGLPVDDYSTENGILASKGKRWPLCIDPQAQANKWIKNMESRAGMRAIKAGEASLLRELEAALRVGGAVLLEDVSESLERAAPRRQRRCGGDSLQRRRGLDGDQGQKRFGPLHGEFGWFNG